MVESITNPNVAIEDASSPSKHRSWIQSAYEQRPFPQIGEKWFLISSKWWQAHIVHGIPAITLDNCDILDPDTKKLKQNLFEGPLNDYILVHSELWEQIHSRYETATGCEIPRKVIEENDRSARVEVYPFEFQVRSSKVDEVEKIESWNQVTFSCKATMSTIAATVLRLLNIPDDSHKRWWRRSKESSDSDPFQLVDFDTTFHDGKTIVDPALDQINVATGDYIVVQHKHIDEIWPDDLQISSDPSSRKFTQGGIVSILVEDWVDGRIVRVDERNQRIFVQPVTFPTTIPQCFAFDSEQIRIKNVNESANGKDIPSPDSSSSSGSFSRNKRSLEGGSKTGYHGTVPVASRLRLGRGIKGLQNLGNTCFMASTLQCLNRTQPFTDYFISKNYARDLNFANPLGLQGQLAKEYAKLLHEIWFEPPDRPSGASSSIAPFGIKKVIGTHAPIFSGFRQHDSQELLAFLLDGLHEDVNRVAVKPYTSTVESNGRDDEIAAEEAWNMHLSRNSSIVVDLFQGQLKSTLVCPKCQRVSVTFDPMMYLSLPLTPFDMRSISITFVYAAFSIRPVVKTVEVPKRGSISDMSNIVGQRFGIISQKLIICDIHANDCHKIFARTERISTISPSDMIFAYEISNELSDLPITWVKHAHVSSPNSTILEINSSVLFAFPRPIFIPQGTTLSSVHSDALAIASSVCNPESPALSADDIIVKIASRTRGYSYSQVISTDDASKWDISSNAPCDIIIHWSASAHASMFDSTQNIMMRSLSMQRSSSTDVTLQDCIELFTSDEILSKEDAWYCSTCKVHQQATKKFELWRLPKILIVHLKRFQYTTYSRNKLDNFVDYPIAGLDLTQYQFVQGRQRESPVIYDLYAISNHYGGFGGGHYTAYGKVSDDQWYSFDDSSTYPISADQIKTRAAYVLFYQLRDNMN